MPADRLLWIPLLASAELRRDLSPLLARAVPLLAPEAVERLWAAWPGTTLDPLWATDGEPHPGAFHEAARALVGEETRAVVVARAAAAEAAADASSERPAFARLARGEALRCEDVLVLPFDDRRLPSIGWIADRASMRSLEARIRSLADTSVPVLVSGESGTGKELVARALHRFGSRSREPWLALNCAELADGLLESELFGHRRGAFTGALRDREGLLAAAGRGTVFLDEVGELSLAAQAKLLRVVEEHRVRPLGAEAGRAIECRLVTATNRDLAAGSAAGQFRADLLYRLRGAEIGLPPLRARPRDLPHLCDLIVARAAIRFGRPIRGLALDARMAIAAHDWPGNVRELRQVLDAAVLATDDEWIRASALAPSSGPRARTSEPLVTVRALERAHLLRALEATAGKRGAAARLLGLSRQSFARRLRRHGLEPPATPSVAVSDRR